MAYAGQTPGTDQTLAYQPLEDRADMLDKSRIERHAAAGIGSTRDVVLVGHYIRVEKKQVEPRQSQAFEAPLNRPPQERFDFLGRRVAEIAFAGDPDPVRQAAAESLADDLFGLTITVARRQVDKVYPGSNCCVHGRDPIGTRAVWPRSDARARSPISGGSN